MQLGFFTACLPAQPLERVAEWAAAHGFAALEVAAWPASTVEPGKTAHVDAKALTEGEATRLAGQIRDLGLTVSSLGYYENNLAGDQPARVEVNTHLRAVIDAAALLGVPSVGTFVGRDVTRPVRDNLAALPDVFGPLIEHARAAGVTLVVENCLMSGWHPDGYPANLAYSPELWELLAGLGLRLNYDPSHLVGIGIDPVRALAPHVGLVAHVQAKDVEVLPGRIDRVGFYGNAVDRSDRWDHAWWRYRAPGLGQVDWAGVTGTLREGGYDGVVSIEHEDPLYQGDDDRVHYALLLARDYLAPLIDGTGASPDSQSFTAGFTADQAAEQAADQAAEQAARPRANGEASGTTDGRAVTR